MDSSRDFLPAGDLLVGIHPGRSKPSAACDRNRCSLRDDESAIRNALRVIFEHQASRDIAGLLKFDKIHRVLGEGNFVLTVSEGQFAGKPTSFYDLWRVENGKIAEHWDTVEAIPEKAEWKNSNGKF